MTGNAVCTGFLGNQHYITPLHHTSVVPGHSTPRISVCDTGSTKLGMLVQVRCHVKTSLCPPSISRSLALSNLINLIHKSMIDDGDILPHCFSYVCMKRYCKLNGVPVPWMHHDWNEAIGYAHLDPIKDWPKRKRSYE